MFIFFEAESKWPYIKNKAAVAHHSFPDWSIYDHLDLHTELTVRNVLLFMNGWMHSREEEEKQRREGNTEAGHIWMTVKCFSEFLSHTCKMTQMLANCSTLSAHPSSLMCIYMKIPSCLPFQHWVHSRGTQWQVNIAWIGNAMRRAARKNLRNAETAHSEWESNAAEIFIHFL